MFTHNRVFKHKEFVSNLHVCSNALGIKWASYIFHFFTRILTSTHTKKFNIFFEKYMSRSPTFTFYFISRSLHDYWPPSSWKSLIHTSLGETERCRKRAFQLLKMRKNKISWNIKTKWVTDFYWKIGLRVWRIVLVISWWEHKRQTFTLISIKIMWILKFFVYTEPGI